MYFEKMGMMFGKMCLCLGVGVLLFGCEFILEEIFFVIFLDVIVRECVFGGWELELEVLFEEGGGWFYKVEC